MSVAAAHCTNIHGLTLGAYDFAQIEETNLWEGIGNTLKILKLDLEDGKDEQGGFYATSFLHLKGTGLNVTSSRLVYNILMEAGKNFETIYLDDRKPGLTDGFSLDTTVFDLLPKCKNSESFFSGVITLSQGFVLWNTN